MKNLSSAVLGALAIRYGTEPVNILAIQWVENGAWHKYADKDIPDAEVVGRITEISTLESIIKMSGAGQSQGISVELEDGDGVLKDIINNNNPYGRPVKVYQWFEGMPIDLAFQLYEGEISSPLVWSEGSRALTFNIITKLADNEIGFSPEEGHFPNLPDVRVGVPWPLAFGTVQNVPGQSIQEIPSSQLATDVGVPDPSLEPRIEDLDKQIKNLKAVLLIYYYALLQAEFTAEYGDTAEQRQYGASQVSTISSNIDQIISTINSAEAELVNLVETLQEQVMAAKGSLRLLKLGLFPNTIFTLQARNAEIVLDNRGTGEEVQILGRSLSHYSWDLGDDPIGYTHIPAGTNVAIKNDYPVQYVVNLLPSTVHHVQAFRRLENNDILSTVPSSWYRVEEQNIGAYIVTLVIFDEPLSSHDITFQDDVFVTLTSSVGPNTVDIIQWLVETYTTLTCDPVSFAAVKGYLENYPSHFALLERKNIFASLEEIAWQSRCAIWIQNNTIYLKYLALEEDSVDTLTESDIDVGTLTLTGTNMDDVVTKFVALWTDDYAQTELNKIILRHNVKLYGTREREYSFYIYNIQELVLKSATFWLIRYANVWKNIEFVTHLHKLSIETFDTVLFDFSQPFVVNDTVKGLITSQIYDSASRTIEMGAWLPVRFGEMEPYDFAWPADISTEFFYPSKIEIDKGYAGGNGPGKNTAGGWYIREVDQDSMGYTSSESLRESGARDQRRDYGDLIPSDLDDIKPFPIFAGVDVTPGEAPEYDYGYGDYGLNLSDGEPSSDSFSASSWPGLVIGSSAFAMAEGTYAVNVYESGLGAEPVQRTVKQLQIASGVEVPNGTWVIVILNKYLQPKEKPTDPDEYLEERTMQVAVWL